MFRLEIKTSNAAFYEERSDGTDDVMVPMPEPELARILREVASHLESDGLGESATGSGTVHDLNGNRVGQWSVTA